MEQRKNKKKTASCSLDSPFNKSDQDVRLERVSHNQETPNFKRFRYLEENKSKRSEKSTTKKRGEKI